MKDTSPHFGTLPWFSQFYFLTDFDALKSVLESFSAHRWKIIWKCGCRSTHVAIVHPHQLLKHPWWTTNTVSEVRHGCFITLCGCTTAIWVLRHPHFHTILHLCFPRSLRKSDLKTCIAVLYPDFFCLTFFTWWPEMTLTCIMVTKHKKWYLQMSVTLFMPIHWLCLRLTSKFYSPMSPSPKSRKFLLWPDLWRHQRHPGQIFDLVGVFHVHGYRMALEIWKSVQ